MAKEGNCSFGFLLAEHHLGVLRFSSTQVFVCCSCQDVLSKHLCAHTSNASTLFSSLSVIAHDSLPYVATAKARSLCCIVAKWDWGDHYLWSLTEIWVRSLREGISNPDGLLGIPGQGQRLNPILNDSGRQYTHAPTDYQSRAQGCAHFKRHKPHLLQKHIIDIFCVFCASFLFKTLSWRRREQLQDSN